MADLRDMAAVILFCGGWRRQWLAQNAHFPEMPLAKKKKEKLKKYRPFTRLVRSSLCGKSAHCTRTHWVYAGKKKEKPQTDNFTKKKEEETAGMRFLFWNWPRPSLFFFISSLGCLWLHFLDIRKLVRYSFASETNRIAPTFSLSFVIIQIGAFKCRSDQLSSACYEQPWRNAVGQLLMDCSSFAAEQKEKGQQQKQEKVHLPAFRYRQFLLLFVVDRVHNILSRMAIAFIFVGLYLLVQGRSRLFLSLSCLCLCCVHSTCTCLQLTSPLRHTSMTMAIPHFSNIERTHEVVSFDVGQFDACTETPMAFQFAFTSCLALSRLISARHSGRICACARDISRWKRLSGCREVGLAGANNSQDATNLPVGREKINWVFAICLAVCWPLPLQPIACHFRMRDVRRGQTFGAIAAVLFLCLFSLDQKKKLF